MGLAEHALRSLQKVKCVPLSAGCVRDQQEARLNTVVFDRSTMVRSQHASRAVALLFLLLLSSMLPILPATPVTVDDTAAQLVAGRAQTTWSGTVQLTASMTIPVTDELVIEACTTVQFAAGVRLMVDGRLTVEGTTTCPVLFEASSSLDHEGLQFNSSSTGRGSKIDNLTIVDATYGVTMFGGDARINNLTIENPDRVGMDLFGATPVIEDLIIDQAGRSIVQTDWRFGIGLSVGAGSAPVVRRAGISDVLTRGLNIWGGSGGVFQDVSIDNASGSTWAFVAGAWVEDSVPLLQRMEVDRSDTGLVVRHVDDTVRTRAVIKDLTVTNSMYRGVYLDKQNHTNYSNYEIADITGLTVIGTGGAGAKTPGIAEAAIEVNATGAWLEDVLVDGCSTVGVRMYFTDSSTTFRNLTVLDAGDAGAGAGPHSAGVAVRASFFAPHFEGLTVSGAPGSGLHATSGGAVQGSNWNLSGNMEYGLRMDRSEGLVDGLVLDNNGFAGALVEDGRRVEWFNLSANGNGFGGVLDGQRAGLHYVASNDIETNNGDVRCRNCSVSGNAGSGIRIDDSVDLWLENISVQDVPIGEIPIVVDNGGLNIGQLGGRFRMVGIDVWANATTSAGDLLPAVDIASADGAVEHLRLHGVHDGLHWNADIPGQRASYLYHSVLDDAGCLELTDQKLLKIHDLDVGGCAGSLSLVASDVNLTATDLTTYGGTIDVEVGSTLHFSNSPVNPSTTITVDATSLVEEAWPVEVWVRNLIGNGVPAAAVDLTFSAVAPSRTLRTGDVGYLVLEDAIARVIDVNGPSSYGVVNVTCAYDGVSTSLEVTFSGPTTVYCDLPLSNQAPFLNWTSPDDESVFPSGGAVLFDASASWDLDDDPLTLSWTSDLDGDILNGCLTVPSGTTPFTANGEDAFGCSLSDGVHVITLEVCDGGAGHCVSESRTIELVNLPPVLNLKFSPGLSPWSELIMPQTGTVTINTTGTFDPEGDDFACLITFSGYNRQGAGWGNQWTCPEELTYTFDHVLDEPPASFTLTVLAWDEVGNNATYSVPVMLYNEVPAPEFEVLRDGNSSEDIVLLDGTGIVDPENDDLTYTWTSSLDGILLEGTGPTFSSWDGWLSRGVHTISLSVNDGRAEHVGDARSSSVLLTVDNSLPRSLIASPLDEAVVDSADLLTFSAEGSGDWDASCATFPTNLSWWCLPGTPAGGSEFLTVVWESDIDGRLTPEGVDWLIFDARLSAGSHTITLSMDDGVHDPVVDTIVVDVVPSAPVLVITSPETGTPLASSDPVLIDVTSSFDADGDAFDLTVLVEDEVVLDGVDPALLHQIWLPGGNHRLEMVLEDSTGLQRTGVVDLSVSSSAPQALILSPDDRASLAPGALVELVDGSVDRDGDLVVREWRLWTASGPVVVSTLANDTLSLAPGNHHLSLHVRDARGAWSEDHVNITVQSSLPRFTPDSLNVNPREVPVGALTTLTLSAELSDADGTTELVQATVTHEDQTWTFNLSDDDGDGVWSGSIDVVFDDLGRPYVRVVAIDGEGEDAQIDVISVYIDVVEAPADGRATVFAAGLGGLVVLLLVANALLNHRRKQHSDGVVGAWGVLDETVKVAPDLAGADESAVGGGFDWDSV